MTARGRPATQDHSRRSWRPSLNETSPVRLARRASAVRGGGLGLVAIDILAAVYPPRVADGHDGGRQQVHLRRWQRPPVAVRFTSAKAQRAVLFNPELGWAKPTWTAHSWSSRARSRTCSRSCCGKSTSPRPNGRCRRGSALSVPALQQFNPPSRSRRNVAHHYDLDGRLYSLFLDADQQYSCAYFESPDQSLDDAQLAKKRHLAAKLRSKPGRIGARHRLRLGRPCALSRRDRRRQRHRHHAVAGTVCRARRPGARARPAKDAIFRLEDYRDVDRPLRSHRVGRHVRACRRRLLRHLLRKCAELLADDGVFLLHTIGRSGPERHQSLDRQIHLPGRLHPGALRGAARDQRAAAGRHRRRNPAAALCRDAQGLARALSRPSRGGRAALRSRFVRMWEFYLASSEMAFREATWWCSRSRWPSARASCRRRAITSRAKKRGCVRSKRLLCAAATRRRVARAVRPPPKGGVKSRFGRAIGVPRGAVR
jgi:cyclopropane-fatty-acyl-phospholipid synthase